MFFMFPGPCFAKIRARRGFATPHFAPILFDLIRKLGFLCKKHFFCKEIEKIFTNGW